MQHQPRRLGAGRRLVLLLAALLALASLPASPLHATQPQLASNSPDLFIQSLALDPPNPLPGQLVTVNVVVKNVGDVAVPADDANRFGTFLYVDPQQQPPGATTPETSFFVWNLGLAPGASFTWSYANYIFPTAGCNHLLYAWVDRANRVAEGNESNNLASVNMCVGTSGDLFEPDDGCTQARDITSGGGAQSHRFQRQGDQDWVRFTATGGVSLTMTTANPAAGVSPQIALYRGCDLAFDDPVAQGAQVADTSATPRVYYARVSNAGTGNGSEASYDLILSSSPCAPGPADGDGSAAGALDLPTTGAPRTFTTCPAGVSRWARFSAQAGTVYAIQTSRLADDADTELRLYDSDATTLLASNDDYTYGHASRIVWRAPRSGSFYANVRQHQSEAAGPATRFDLSIATGLCLTDAAEPDNGPARARAQVTDGQPQPHSFCADPIAANVSDQDWVRFDAVAGAPYTIATAQLGADSDTTLDLFASDGTTLLASNDDRGLGRSSAITFTATLAGRYFARVTSFDSGAFGGETSYQLSISGQIAPPPPPPPPPPPIDPAPSSASTNLKTLLLVNRQRLAALYGAASADALMSKLYELANHASVQGAVVQVENNPAVAAAYAQWTGSPAALASTANVNNVASAVRNLLLSLLGNNGSVEYVVIVGGDSVVPYRRVPEGALSKTEDVYAPKLAPDTPLRTALAEKMVLTDDYYVDREPTAIAGHELYLPDYALGRLIEQPAEITALIDTFLANQTIPAAHALVTGYDFAADGAAATSAILKNDGVPTDDELIGVSWSGDMLRDKQLRGTGRFELQSLNGHATHIAFGTPNESEITANEIAAASSDLARTVIYSIGCHAGLNESGVLDIPQAFAQRRANYIGNTGFGWGGGGVTFSEALMRGFFRKLVTGTSSRIGPALAAAKQAYYSRTSPFGAYDEKVLMQATLYGLPMYGVTTGATLGDDDPFPSATTTFNAEGSFGSVSEGELGYGLPGSFGAFDSSPTASGSLVALDGSVSAAAGQPTQPLFFATVPTAGGETLHGALMLSGVYTNVRSFDPVVSLPVNEYVSDRAEPALGSDAWYAATPFEARPGGAGEDATVVTVLGQYDPRTGTERLYDQLAFATFASPSLDRAPPQVSLIDGVLSPTSGRATFKVEASDPSQITRVVITATDGAGTWQSHDLSYNAAAGKWTGAITATLQTQYFVQVVDGAGNVTADDAKGRYYGFVPPLPLVQDTNTILLPLTMKGG